MMRDDIAHALAARKPIPSWTVAPKKMIQDLHQSRMVFDRL